MSHAGLTVHSYIQVSGSCISGVRARALSLSLSRLVPLCRSLRALAVNSPWDNRLCRTAVSECCCNRRRWRAPCRSFLQFATHHHRLLISQIFFHHIAASCILDSLPPPKNRAAVISTVVSYKGGSTDACMYDSRKGRVDGSDMAVRAPFFFLFFPCILSVLSECRAKLGLDCPATFKPPSFSFSLRRALSFSLSLCPLPSSRNKAEGMPAVLALHGFSSESVNMAPLFPVGMYPPGARVVLLDTPGT